LIATQSGLLSLNFVSDPIRMARPWSNNGAIYRPSAWFSIVY
jgi:hypothetical protein